MELNEGLGAGGAGVTLGEDGLLVRADRASVNRSAKAFGGVFGDITEDAGIEGVAGATGIEARDAIMAEGVRRAQSAFGVPSFERIVYVGDAAWDVAASRTARMPLIGISDPEERLLSQGVSHVLPNYQDLIAFQDAVDNARVP